MHAIANTTAGAFEEYRGEVYAWAYRLLGNSHDAEDVVQDVYLRWDRQCREALPAWPRGWLRRVTLNRAVDVCRRFPRLASADEELDGAASVPANSGEHAIDHEVLRMDLARAFEHLSDMQRSVIVAKVYDGMTFAEIADEQELAVSTVKTHWLRGVRALNGRLRSRWGDSSTEPGTGQVSEKTA